MTVASLALEAKRFGSLTLLENTYVEIKTRGKTIEAAVIDGFQRTPASKYYDGVDVSILRYNSLDLGIPDDVYKLRVRSTEKINRTGRFHAVSELYSSSGDLVFSCPHAFDVTSVELPSDGTDLDNVVIRVNNFIEDRRAHTFESHLEWTLDYCCPNGTCGTCIGRACPPE
ncbi:hypothetical protein AWB78_03927 [Caballeronia calidae]|uniref:Uncharacterized protein n=1 Tax=Caballeronia calidae TaxID=1777139 RepID=A0A158CGX2_9BURK|nr:hypothetical protein [Caballeronia calidae]SAK81594.1 hypothetical protein AWB78_03927 [Caballeronia calidae]